MEEEITLKDVVEEESAGKDSFEEIGTSVLADAEHFRLKGLRCTICFSYLGSAEEAFEKGDNASFTTMTHLFQCLRFSTRAGKVEETNLPLCLLCEENLVEVKRVVDQIIELENVVQSLEDEVKSKLINSFDESLLEPESHMMEKVAKVRAEMVQRKLSNIFSIFCTLYVSIDIFLPCLIQQNCDCSVSKKTKSLWVKAHKNCRANRAQCRSGYYYNT